jgi:hypothetical protein
VTPLAVRVPVVDRETFASAAVERAVSGEISGGSTRWKKRVTTFRTEKVLRVIGALAQPISLAKGNIILVRDCGLAVVAPRGEFLRKGISTIFHTIIDYCVTS